MRMHGQLARYYTPSIRGASCLARLDVGLFVWGYAMEKAGRFDLAAIGLVYLALFAAAWGAWAATLALAILASGAMIGGRR